MIDSLNVFRNLRRSRLLIEAARIALPAYRRERDLRRLLRAARLPAPRASLPRLLAYEADLEALRREGHTTYSARQHVAALTALIAEAGLARRSGQA